MRKLLTIAGTAVLLSLSVGYAVPETESNQCLGVSFWGPLLGNPKVSVMGELKKKGLQYRGGGNRVIGFVQPKDSPRTDYDIQAVLVGFDTAKVSEPVICVQVWCDEACIGVFDEELSQRGYTRIVTHPKDGSGSTGFHINFKDTATNMYYYLTSIREYVINEKGEEVPAGKEVNSILVGYIKL